MTEDKNTKEIAEIINYFHVKENITGTQIVYLGFRI